MYRLTDLLSRGQSGLYLLTGTLRPIVIERLCRLKGVRLFRLDGISVLTKKRFLAVAARAFNFPGWFGANWDAFEDCVTDLEWVPASAYVVLLEDMEGFAAHSQPDFLTALAILEAAAKFWSEQGIPFHVLVSEARTDSGFLPRVSAI